MPFTFLAHQAPVLPLKLIRPAWFSGTALVLGSMAPDFEYFIRGEPISTMSHTLLGQVVFCLPTTLVAVVLVERVLAPTLPSHLPELGLLHVRDYARLSRPARSFLGWLLVAVSALIGSISHIAWDGFTHGHGWAVEHLPALNGPAFEVAGRTVPIYKVLQHGSTFLGGLATLAMLFVIGRSRLLLSWREAPDPPRPNSTSTSHLLTWLPVLLGAVIGGVVFLAGSEHDGTLLRSVVCVFLRATSTAFVGLCLGCLLASKALTRETPRAAVDVSPN